MPEGRRPRGVTRRLTSGREAESARLRRHRNGREELPLFGGQEPAARRSPATEVRGGDERSYPASEVRVWEERSYLASEVRFTHGDSFGAEARRSPPAAECDAESALERPTIRDAA